MARASHGRRELARQPARFPLRRVAVNRIFSGLRALLGDAPGGGIKEDDYRALTNWLLGRKLYPLSQIALVGRQGASVEDGAALRAELLQAHSAIQQEGGSIRIAISQWARISLNVRRGEIDALSQDDLIRAAFLGHLPRVRARVAAERPDGALGLVFAWMAHGTFDVEAALALGNERRLEDAWVSPEAPDAWFPFLRANEHARSLLHQQTRSAKAQAKRADPSNGDTMELVHHERETIRLRTAIVAAWDLPAERSALPNAFRHFYEATFDFYFVQALLAASCLEAQIGGTASPDEVLARFRGFVREPEPSPPPNIADDPALRAIATIEGVLRQGNGLTLVVQDGMVRCEARPQAQSRDFI
jgi:hypothetical protein